MFNSVLAQHAQRQLAQREENEHARRAAAAALAAVTEDLASAVNDGVADVFNNQRVIEAEARELQVQAQQFAKQTTRWINMVNEFDKALKEVGDFENWVKVMEWDMQSVATALEAAAQATGSSPEKGTPDAPRR